MTGFHTKRLPTAPDVVAPDGSDVRILLALNGGSMAHFELAPAKPRLPSPTARSRKSGTSYVVAARCGAS